MGLSEKRVPQNFMLDHHHFPIFSPSKYGHANSRDFLAVPHHHAALVVLPAMLTTGDLHEFLLGLVHARHGTRPAFEGRCPKDELSKNQSWVNSS
jgi:hypothetical protein